MSVGVFCPLITVIFSVFTFINCSFARTAVNDDLLYRIKRACVESYPKEYLINYVIENVIHSSELEHLTDVFSIYLEPGKKFVDLGSGDGRVVFLASLYGVVCIFSNQWTQRVLF